MTAAAVDPIAFVGFPGEPPRLPVVERAADLNPDPPVPVARCWVKAERAFHRFERGLWAREAADTDNRGNQP